MAHEIQKLASLIQQQTGPCLIKKPDGSYLSTLKEKIPANCYIEIAGKILKLNELINQFKHSGFKIVIKKHSFSSVKLMLQKETPLATHILGFSSKDLHNYCPKDKPNVCSLKYD